LISWPMRRVGFLRGFGGLAFSPKKLFRQEDRIYRINKNSLGVLNAALNRERSLICKQLIICVL